MIDAIYIEVLGYIAVVLGVSSYLIKKQNATRFTMGCAQTFMGLHFWLLGGFTAGVIQGVLAARTWASNYVKNKTARHMLFFVTVGLCLALAAMTWGGWKSLIPLFAGLNATYAICYMNNKKMRKILILSSYLYKLIIGIFKCSAKRIANPVPPVSLPSLVQHITNCTGVSNFLPNTIMEFLPCNFLAPDLQLCHAG